ncbi:MAG: hypothetical protein ABI947_12280 [Chloroflexota bacterium]
MRFVIVWEFIREGQHNEINCAALLCLAAKRSHIARINSISQLMTNDRTPIEKFWDAVIAVDYKVVRKAIAEGFDVNAKIPGKVEPIVWAQSAEDMKMLKILWAAGAPPATPWLEAVFADFANGGNGSKFKRKKSRQVGKFILHRFNGDEEFALGPANIHIGHDENGSWLGLEAYTNGTVIKSLPDTEELYGRPHAFISAAVSQTKDLVGVKLSVSTSYDDSLEDYISRFYYLRHESLDANEVEFLSRRKDKYLVRWTGQTPDVNYYDGSKPDTYIEIEGWFTVKSPS